MNAFNLITPSYKNIDKSISNFLTNNYPTDKKLSPNDIQTSLISDKQSLSLSLINEYSYSNNQKGFSLHALSKKDLSIMREDIDLNINLSYEALGINKEDTEKPKDKKFSFSFTLNLIEINAVKESKMSITKKTRSAEEIMRDITSAVGKALSGKKGKSISIELDKEAMDAIGGSEAFRKLLIELMIFINLSKSMNKGRGGHEVIRISGKAGYHMEYEEKVSVNMNITNINVNISISPSNNNKTEEDKNLSILA